MKYIKSFLIVACLAILGTSCAPTPEPTPEGTFYAIGNGKDDPTGVWMFGESWYSSPNNQLVKGSITYYDVPAGVWEFKITQAETKQQFGFAEMNAETSTPKYTEGKNNRVQFRVLNNSNITIQYDGTSITLTSSQPFYSQEDIESMWPATINVAEAGEFLKIEKGSFTMGDNNSQWSTEKPEHKVTLSHCFYMASKEFTQALWQKTMGSNPSEIKGDNKPVTNVSYQDVKTFIEKLNKKTGRTFRLPTEAEWEFVAMGGTQSMGYVYSGSNNVDEVAWYIRNSNDDLQDVATKKANELGIYDMSGNAAEWCLDGFSAYRSNEVVDPVNLYGSTRVIRGGKFDDPARALTNKVRLSSADNLKFYNLGFRLVMEEPLSEELLPLE